MAAIYGPRSNQQAGMPPTGNPALPPNQALPLGSMSVIASQNGLVNPVRYVPVPVPTVPQPWRPPVPPPPELPQAPQAATYVNAFSPPRMPQPVNNVPPQGGAFTAPPGNGPSMPPITYGPTPYGPMPYGAMPDPRMMGYGPAPYGPYADPRMMAYGQRPTGRLLTRAWPLTAPCSRKPATAQS